MKKTRIIIHQNNLDDVVKKLHETGFLEIIDISKEEKKEDDYITTAEMNPEAEVCSNYELRLTRIIDILKKNKQKKTGIKSILNPEIIEKKSIDESNLDELYSYAEGILGDIEKNILDNEGKISKIKEEIGNINTKLKQLSYFKDFNLNLSNLGESKYLITKIGLTDDIFYLKQKLKKLDKVVLYSKQIDFGKKPRWSVIITGYISEKQKIYNICRENYEEIFFEDEQVYIKDLLQKLINDKKNLQKEKKEMIKNLRKYSKNQLNDLLALREEINIEKNRGEIQKNFLKTKKTYIIKGWVLEENVEKLKKILRKTTDDRIIMNFKTPSANPDNPPTHMKVPSWADGFKGLLEMFATPKYNEINPTIIMGIFFVLFFGIMLGDAGYGIILLALSLFGYIKFSKISDTIRAWSFMGIWMGIITTIVGFLTYSIFGNFFHMILIGKESTSYLYNFNLFGINFPVDSLRDPLIILTVALILGLIHLNIGVILGIIQSARQKKYKEMLTERFCWVPLQIGGGSLIGKFILGWEISGMFFYISAVLIIVGIIQLFIAKGPIGFFDITGYVGDWLSYARLLALGLATAGMALAFNEVSTLLGEMIPYAGIVITIILLIILHVVNLGLSALGAGVHSLRLQYVEFFNRFYEGGGNKFSPFKLKRMYTKIGKNEKIE